MSGMGGKGPLCVDDPSDVVLALRSRVALGAREVSLSGTGQGRWGGVPKRRLHGDGTGMHFHGDGTAAGSP